MADEEDGISPDGMELPAMNAIDPKPVATTSVASSMENVATVTEPSAAKDDKMVTITEPAKEAACDIDLTTEKSNAEKDADELDDEPENGNIPMEMGVGKKKKKKSKPKSKRGLVSLQFSRDS
jgi:hypothetical protein